MNHKALADAAKNGYAMYGSLARELMHSHGEEMVYEAVASMGEAAGVESGRGSKAGVEQFAKQLLESQLAGGWDSEVKVEGGKVTLINHTCPCYSGMREAGLSHEQAKNMCYAWWRRFPDNAKRENSSVVGYKIEKYRSNESGICHEVFEFKK